MMAAYALRPLLLYLHLYTQLVPRKPALDDPHTELLPASVDWWPIATPPFGCFLGWFVRLKRPRYAPLCVECVGLPHSPHFAVFRGGGCNA